MKYEANLLILSLLLSGMAYDVCISVELCCHFTLLNLSDLMFFSINPFLT